MDMNREHDHYRTLLLARQAELERSLRSRDDLAVERAPDELDAIHLAQARYLAIAEVDRETRQLRDIKAALARIADGSFGVCLGCEGRISDKRLNVVPWAAYCVRCQAKIDQENMSDGHASDDGRVNESVTNSA
jgi:DnaK suppressor protein